MNRILIAALVAILGLAAQSASAQVPFRQYGPDPLLDRPAVSPYMLLMQRGTNSAGQIPYFTFVQPQLQAQAAMAGQQGQLRQLQNQLNAGPTGAAAGMRTTGHHTYFNNYSHFYNAPVTPTSVRRQ